MVAKKYNHCLAMGIDSFSTKIISKRLSKRRLKIHFKLNTIKKKFKNNLHNKYKYLKNKDDEDPITLQKINTIPLNNLFIYNLSNGEMMGANSSNLLKWLLTFEYDEFPKNIFTNEEMTYQQLWDCYNQSYNYYCNNMFFKQYYIKKYPDKYKEKYELTTALQTFYLKNMDRINPQGVLLRFQSVIDDNIKVVADYMSCIFGYTSIEDLDLTYCANIHTDIDFLGFDFDISTEYLDIISRHSLYALSYMEQYNELQYKINSGYFNRF